MQPGSSGAGAEAEGLEEGSVVSHASSRGPVLAEDESRHDDDVMPAAVTREIGCDSLLDVKATE